MERCSDDTNTQSPTCREEEEREEKKKEKKKEETE